MARTSAGNVYSNPFKTVFNLIKDNTTIASGTFAMFPQGNIVTYPLNTVESANTNPTFKSFGRQSRGLEFNFEISCFAESVEQTDELANEIDKIATQNQEVTNKSGLNFQEVNASAMEHPIINGKMVHTKLMNVNYMWTGDIT